MQYLDAISKMTEWSLFPRQIIQYHGNSSLCPNQKCWRSEVERLYEEPQDLLQLTIKNILFFHYAAKSLQSCPTLCDPIESSPPGSPVPGILQARTLEWVAISCSNAWKWKVKVKSLSHVQLLVTPWTAVHQAPTSMGFSRQEHWSGVPLPSPTFTSKFICEGRCSLTHLNNI